MSGEDYQRGLDETNAREAKLVLADQLASDIDMYGTLNEALEGARKRYGNLWKHR